MAERELTFWEHLDALRRVLFRIAAVVFGLGIAAFCLMPWIFDHIVMWPCRSQFPTYQLLDNLAGMGIFAPEGASIDFQPELITTELASQFFMHVSASCWTAAIVAFPVIIYQLWGFVSPGLYPRERRGAVRAFVAGNIMFYIGAAVGYFVVFPLALHFLTTYSLSEVIHPMITLESYMDNFFMLMLAMGAVFELPLVAWLLGKMGLLTRGFFNRWRRHAIVVLLIAAALITPTGDPFTLSVVFFPLYILWEFGALLVPKSPSP